MRLNLLSSLPFDSPQRLFILALCLFLFFTFNEFLWRPYFQILLRRSIHEWIRTFFFNFKSNSLKFVDSFWRWYGSDIFGILWWMFFKVSRNSKVCPNSFTSSFPALWAVSTTFIYGTQAFTQRGQRVVVLNFMNLSLWASYAYNTKKKVSPAVSALWKKKPFFS